jgi:hypothetical protein
MTQGGFLGPLIILAWLGAFIPAIAWMERHPPQQSRRQAGAIVWNTFFDRIGERFGPRLGPLVGFWLRFNCRNVISRRFMWLEPPMFAFLTFALYNAGQKSNLQGLFLTALGALPLAAFMASGRIVLNQFGYMGGGFRRLLLLPVPPSSLIWSASFTSTILSLAMALLCLIGWVVVAPFPFDLRMIAMLACSALTGLLLLQSASVWATIYNPSRGNYFLKLGNDLSLGANAIFVLGASGPFFAVAAAVYFATLAVAGWALAGRRQKVLAVVQGKR